MKIDTTKLLLLTIALLLVWSNFFKENEPIEIPPVTVTIPETSGGTGVQVVKEYVPYPVYNNGQQYNVDEEWKKKYEQAQDSVAKYKQYLEAIKINNYEKTLVDNDTIQITGKATTRGSLLDYSVDYRIKPIDFSYTPDVRIENPKLSLGIGAEIGVPTRIGQNFTLKGNFNLMNKKGHEINLGYDTNNTAWFGYTRNFKLIK